MQIHNRPNWLHRPRSQKLSKKSRLRMAVSGYEGRSAEKKEVTLSTPPWEKAKKGPSDAV